MAPKGSYEFPLRTVKASKEYTCDWDCDNPILKGEVHAYSPFLNTGVFATARYHLDCREARDREWIQFDSQEGDPYCPRPHVRGNTCYEMGIDKPLDESSRRRRRWWQLRRRRRK